MVTLSSREDARCIAVPELHGIALEVSRASSLCKRLLDLLGCPWRGSESVAYVDSHHAASSGVPASVLSDNGTPGVRQVAKRKNERGSPTTVYRPPKETQQQHLLRCVRKRVSQWGGWRVRVSGFRRFLGESGENVEHAAEPRAA